MTQRQEPCELLERQIAQLSRQLERANQNLQRSREELQEFAYLASHDLQEPLRKIEAFGDLLITRHGESLGEDGQDYLRRMQYAAERMATLIDDLLAYARVTSKARAFETVDLNQIAADVIRALESQIQEVSGEVRCESLPVVEADPTQMCQLFRHIIRNALLYHRPDATPHVVIGEATPLVGELPQEGTPEEYCQIRFLDDGIGIDPKYARRVFQPFQRLHTRQEYDGTGMGLAICRRIIERHAGSIHLQPDVDCGAAFLVTLPKSQSAL
jgi:light-regulated signal transduction histidine kinase (bacteriophytochrome)